MGACSFDVELVFGEGDEISFIITVMHFGYFCELVLWILPYNLDEFSRWVFFCYLCIFLLEGTVANTVL